MRNEMARFKGKKYEFSSHHAIPPVIKEWLQENNISCAEKDLRKCDSLKKEYPQ